MSTDLLQYNVIIGRNAQLICEMSLNNVQEVAIIFWYKGNSELPIYTIDIRNSSLKKANHILSKSYKKRAYFNLFSSKPFLKIESVKLEDEDQYRCRVDYRKFPTQNTLFNLTVIGKVFVKKCNNSIKA